MAKKTSVSSGSLAARLQASTIIKHASTIADSAILKEKLITVPTEIPAINIAASAMIDGGIMSGITQIVGPSKHFKSLVMLLCLKAYLDYYEDAVGLLYDCEFGASLNYFEAVGIDPNRVVWKPFTNIEELRFDMMQTLDTIERGEHVFIAIDSIGNAASKKEVEDALAGKAAQDMTRAKVLKGFGRSITPILNLKNIPMFAVNHVYLTQDLYPQVVVSGGTGIYLSSDAVWLMRRQVEKDGDEKVGYNFDIFIDKSRTVKERSVISLTVRFEGGIDRLSGMFELALEAGFIVPVNKQTYHQAYKGISKTPDEKGQKRKTFGPYLEEVMKHPEFKAFVKDKFWLDPTKLLQRDSETDEDDTEEDDFPDA
jgi:hypothetical protein